MPNFIVYGFSKSAIIEKVVIQILMLMITPMKPLHPGTSSGLQDFVNSFGNHRTLKNPVTAIDQKVVAGVIGTGIAHDVDGETGKILRGPPPAHGNSLQYIVHEPGIAEISCCHGGFDPAGHHRMSRYTPAGITDSK